MGGVLLFFVFYFCLESVKPCIDSRFVLSEVTLAKDGGAVDGKSGLVFSNGNELYGNDVRKTSKVGGLHKAVEVGIVVAGEEADVFLSLHKGEETISKGVRRAIEDGSFFSRGWYALCESVGCNEICVQPTAGFQLLDVLCSVWHELKRSIRDGEPNRIHGQEIRYRTAFPALNQFHCS